MTLSRQTESGEVVPAHVAVCERDGCTFECHGDEEPVRAAAKRHVLTTSHTVAHYERDDLLRKYR